MKLSTCFSVHSKKKLGFRNTEEYCISPTSEYKVYNRMNKLQLNCVLVAFVVCLAGHLVFGWTLGGGNSRSLYNCCCRQCRGQPRSSGSGCFLCRNKEHYCNCDNCSCFPTRNRMIELDDEEDPSGE